MQHQLWAYCEPADCAQAGRVRYISLSMERPRFARHLRAASEPRKRAWIEGLLYRRTPPVLVLLGAYEGRDEARLALIEAVARHRMKNQADLNMAGQKKTSFREQVEFKKAGIISFAKWQAAQKATT